MNKPLPWRPIPVGPLLNALPEFKWSTADGHLPSAKTAALMLYIRLNLIASLVPHNDETGWAGASASPTYDELHMATGLSRALITAGLKKLSQSGLIDVSGTTQRRHYQITWNENRWFKLPCRDIQSADGRKIPAFNSFYLRSKHELHALKLYLYLASVRNNTSLFSMAAYDTIESRIEIPRPDIRRAIGMLIGFHLLTGIDRAHSQFTKKNEPNKYYLSGYESFTKSSAVIAT